MKDWIAALPAKRFAKGRYSQSYQDVLLDEIFANIGTVNTPPFCVEFGFNDMSLTGGSGANVANLAVNAGWDSLLLDGDCENPAINLHKHFLTPDNICEIFAKYNVPKEPEYVSIDINTTDLWVFRALLTKYRARVFSVEYNPNFPLDAAITFPANTDLGFAGDRAYGASLKALTSLAALHGYSLLWVIPKLDAFFIRNDLIDDGSGDLVFPLTRWADCTNRVAHAPVTQDARLRALVDFDEFTASGGKRLSNASTYATCKAFLTDAMDFESIRRRGISRVGRDISRIARRSVRGLFAAPR